MRKKAVHSRVCFEPERKTLMPKIKITEVFRDAYAITSETKKLASDGVRDLLKKANIKLDGKIRFAQDGTVTFNVAKAEEAEKLRAELTKIGNPLIISDASPWDLFVATRGAAVEATEEADQK
jgi:hypothetical protein